MKKIIILLTFFWCFLGYSQTTQEEYNYLTKGYAEQVEKGLDMKQGYDLKDVTSSKTRYTNNKYRQITVKALHKTNSGKFKALLVEFYRSSNNHTIYVCVPSTGSDAEIWKQFNKSIYKDFNSYKEFSQNTIRNFCIAILQMYEANL